MRLASCSASVVSRPAKPGATSFGPPENPAKKCGSTKPVVIRTSASTHSRLSWTGTPSPMVPRSTSVAGSRASWFTMRTDSSSSGPNMSFSSTGVLPL